jgi:hypothetical protein
VGCLFSGQIPANGLTDQPANLNTWTGKSKKRNSQKNGSSRSNSMKIQKPNTNIYAVKRKISLGRQNPEVFEVLGGLQPGERVITSSYDNYGDNIDKLVLK